MGVWWWGFYSLFSCLRRARNPRCYLGAPRIFDEYVNEQMADCSPRPVCVPGTGGGGGAFPITCTWEGGEVDRGVEEVSRSITLERFHLDTWDETRSLPGFLCSLEQERLQTRKPGVIRKCAEYAHASCRSRRRDALVWDKLTLKLISQLRPPLLPCSSVCTLTPGHTEGDHDYVPVGSPSTQAFSGQLRSEGGWCGWAKVSTALLGGVASSL